MSSRRSILITAIMVGLLAGVAYPLVDVAIACRVPTSEACVWGKAYLPLSLSLSIVVVGAMVTALVYGILIWRRRRQSSNDAV
jgi:hypothetical protein